MKNQIVKLTLVTFKCRYKQVSAFLMLPYRDGKPVITQHKIGMLFQLQHGFIPTLGETILIG